MQNVLTAHARHHSPFLESQSVSLGKQAFSLEFHRHCCIFFTRTVEALSHFPQSPPQLRLIHEERQYPNDHKSIGILFQNRGKRSLRVSEMSYLSALLFLSSNGVDLRVKFYYMHLKNVKLEFQRGIEKWPESGWDINLPTFGTDGSQAALPWWGEAVWAREGSRIPQCFVFSFERWDWACLCPLTCRGPPCSNDHL